MKAWTQRRYGPIDALTLEDLPRPSVGPGQVLVRVHASSVHADVWHAVRGEPAVLRLMGAGFLRPKDPVPGIDLAGVVEDAGDSALEVGDRVYGEVAGGFQWKNAGAWAEYAAVDAAALEPMPDGLTFPQAAVTPTSAAIAVQVVCDEGRVRAGQRVLVNGAGGALGCFAVQIAAHIGAEVTAVDRAAKLDSLRSLGAAAAVDFEAQDPLAGGPFDVIIDVASTLSVPRWRAAIAPDGTYVMIGHDDYGRAGRRWLGSIPKMAGLFLRKRWIGHLPDWSEERPYRAKFADAAALVADGAVRPVVARAFPLDQAPDALRYLETGEAIGAVALNVATSAGPAGGR